MAAMTAEVLRACINAQSAPSAHECIFGMLSTTLRLGVFDSPGPKRLRTTS